jgi:predicted adenylyl cyclase CyaB
MTHLLPPARNLELKARCPCLVRARTAIERLEVSIASVEFQTDTYFHVPRGRLKLREINDQSACLIWYDRPNLDQVRSSSYYLIPVPDATRMKAMLTTAFGVRVEVRKRREIYLWHNVRIHLDDVAGLGTFLEFEAVLESTADEAASQGRLDRLMQLLELSPVDSLAPSYGDLLQESRSRKSGDS